MNRIAQLLLCISLGISLESVSMDNNSLSKKLYRDEEAIEEDGNVAPKPSPEPVLVEEIQLPAAQAYGAAAAAPAVVDDGDTKRSIEGAGSNAHAVAPISPLEANKIARGHVIDVFGANHPNLDRMFAELQIQLGRAGMNGRLHGNDDVLAIANRIVSKAVDNPAAFAGYDAKSAGESKVRPPMPPPPSLRRTPTGGIIQPRRNAISASAVDLKQVREPFALQDGVPAFAVANEMPALSTVQAAQLVIAKDMAKLLIKAQLKETHNPKVIKFHINKTHAELVQLAMQGRLELDQIEDTVNITIATVKSMGPVIPMMFIEGQMRALNRLKQRFPDRDALIGEYCRNHLTDELRDACEPYKGEFPDVSLVDAPIDKAICRIGLVDDFLTRLNALFPKNGEDIDSLYRHELAPVFEKTFNANKDNAHDKAVIEENMLMAKQKIQNIIMQDALAMACPAIPLGAVAGYRRLPAMPRLESAAGGSAPVLLRPIPIRPQAKPTANDA